MGLGDYFGSVQGGTTPFWGWRRGNTHIKILVLGSEL